MLWQILASLLVIILMAGAVFAWWLFKPLPSYTLQQRLEIFPQDRLELQGDVTLRWDDYQIPFIEAEYDDDAAFVLGLVHAHLRLTQIEALRLVSQGRISEMVPLKLLADVDAGLRTLGYGRAAEKTYADMPDSTRQWLNQFVKGYNHYKAGLKRKDIPQDLTLLGLDWRLEMTALDILTIGKLTGSSPSWFSHFASLQLATQDNGKNLLKRLRKLGSAGMVSHIPSGSQLALHSSLQALNRLILHQSRSGSNSVVIGGAKSATGSGLIASDPHLGMSIPNFWLIAGLKTPSYHGVGMMIPGVPAFGFGRMKNIAWGGTNLHGQDSDLVDVSDLPAEDFTTETHIIKRRFLPSKKIEIRVSPYGPVFSDLAFLPQADIDYAMAWVGHSSGSDELTALLETMRATDFTQFRHAMRNFAAPGQNFLYADDKGNIGQIVAAHIPLRDGNGDDEYHEKFYLSVADYDNYWRVINDASTLPFAYNPDTHYLASANNRAYAGKPEIGYSYPTGFRYARIAQLVGAQDVWDIASLRGLQDDSYIWSSHSIAQEIVRLFDSQDLNEWDSDYQQQAEIIVPLLRAWDGFYKTSSQGAAHYEFFNPAFSAKLMAQAGDSEFFDLIRRTSRRQLLLKEILSNDDQSKNNLPDEVVKSALQAGIDAWAQAIKNVDGKSADNITWGDIHYVQIQHALGNVPIIGRKYRYRQLPIAGGNSSIFKTGFNDKIGASATSYGTQSQHVSDMADLDENYFVLLGGQDGTIGSPNFYDQALLWHKRELIKLPLRDESVREHYKHVMVLR